MVCATDGASLVVAITMILVGNLGIGTRNKCKRMSPAVTGKQYHCGTRKGHFINALTHPHACVSLCKQWWFVER